MRQKISIRALIKREGKILLLRRSAGRDSIVGKYELPGGRLEDGEQPKDALYRHIEQSLGVMVQTAQLFDVISFIDPDDRSLQYVFILYLVSTEQKQLQLSNKYDKYVWSMMINIQRNTLTTSTEMLLGLDNSTEDKKINEDIKDSIDDYKTTNVKSIIYSDGGSRGNPGPSASAFVIMDVHEQIVAEGGVYLGITTNNQAEYQAVYQALKRAAELHLKVIDFRMDSSLVVNQLNGIYKIKNRDLWPIHKQIKDMLMHFEKVTFSHIKREFNHAADSLVNKILDEHATSR